MYTFLSIVYVLVCMFLIMVVLLQPGRGGMGGAFGGGSSNTVFGGSGAGNFLTRLTSISAALFMLLSATLAYMSSSSDKSMHAAEVAAEAKKATKTKLEAARKKEADKNAKATDGTQAPIELAPPGESDNTAPIELAPPAPAPEQAPAPAAPAAAEKPAAPAPKVVAPKAVAPKPAKPAAPAEPAAPKAEAAPEAPKTEAPAAPATP
jgi:preprotein translocase subunit SecG